MPGEGWLCRPPLGTVCPTPLLVAEATVLLLLAAPQVVAHGLAASCRCTAAGQIHLPLVAHPCQAATLPAGRLPLCCPPTDICILISHLCPLLPLAAWRQLLLLLLPPPYQRIALLLVLGSYACQGGALQALADKLRVCSAWIRMGSKGEQSIGAAHRRWISAGEQ